MEVTTLKNFSYGLVLSAALVSCLALNAMAQADPPSRVARLNFVSGNVSMKPAEVADWMEAELNRPFSSGDYLYTDFGGRAELHADVAVIRAGEHTSFGFTQLDDQVMRIQLNDGDLYLHLHHLDGTQTVEVDTPNATVTLLRDGNYRFRVDANSGVSFLVVRQGTAEVTGGGQAVTVNPGNSLLVSNGAQSSFDLEQAPNPDDFDHWCGDRDTHEAHLMSARYVPPTLIGYEDLDANGAWDANTQYGPVWYPAAVPVGWAPYRFGHWVWISPWGWTWVDNASWGFAPFHYGRWVFVAGRWGWCPGPVVAVANQPAPPRPHYAPALVAWFGGAHWSASIAIGGGAPSVGWVALGVGELYTPPYHCSPHYFNNVNVNNTRVVNNVNITDVYNTVYVNKTVYNQTYVNTAAPNAVVAMRHDAFAGGQPVHQAAIVVPKAQAQALQASSVVVNTPPVNRPAPMMHRQEGNLTAAGKPVPQPAAQPRAFQQQPVQPHPAAAPLPQTRANVPQPPIRHDDVRTQTPPPAQSQIKQEVVRPQAPQPQPASPPKAYPVHSSAPPERHDQPKHEEAKHEEKKEHKENR